VFDELKKYIEEQKSLNRLQEPDPPSDDDESLGRRLRRLGPSPSLADYLGGATAAGTAKVKEEATKGDRITQIVLDVAKEKRDAAQAEGKTGRRLELIELIFISAGCAGLGAAIGLAFMKYFG
jgi:hypothetical protein